jgi:hypothetical protein
MFRHSACERFFAIPKEIILPSRPIAGWLYGLTLRERDPSVDSSRIPLSQFFHFCATWEAGWPFCWDQHLRSVNRSCGLLDQFGPDIKFDLIEDENLGGDEPDCRTNDQRSERE